jgi:fumarate hydratase class II
MPNSAYRVENDSMGEMQVPADAYWGAQTQRAWLNFPVSGLRLPSSFIRALGMIKLAAVQVNVELGLLDRERGNAIAKAASEVSRGELDEQFILDIFQTGSGTSTNMNANEVIASRANELLGGKIGSRAPVHPNDHVNMGQSSNDVIPSCIHISAMEGLRNNLLPALETLRGELFQKDTEFEEVVKIGRTHMQDATPVRLGQEFSGYASMIDHGINRIKNTQEHLAELAIGGTAVGTGINTHPEFARRVVENLNEMTGLAFEEAHNHFEAQGAKDAVVELSGALKTLAVSLMKIANDIRFLGCGPRCGISEIQIPAVQPGSSIMPGKVNPVIAESVCQVAAQVIGNDATIAICGLMGHLELNVMMPVMAYNILQSIEILARVTRIFSEKCIAGIQVNERRIEELIDQSLALCTALSPYIGYDEASAIAKEAYRTGKTISQIAHEKKILTEEELKEILDPRRMT